MIVTHQDADAAFDRGDYATTLRLLRPLADQGDVYAQYNLGVMHDKAHGVPQNYAEALKWYRLAADQGHAVAQGSLGSMYHFSGDYVYAHIGSTWPLRRATKMLQKAEMTLQRT